jgi:hypothetical protein
LLRLGQGAQARQYLERMRDECARLADTDSVWAPADPSIIAEATADDCGR